MKKNLFLVLSIIGVIVPYSQFVPYTNEYGWNGSQMLSAIFANQMSTGIALDALLAAVVVIIWILFEQKRNPIKYIWVPIVGMFAVGLSFALPFYLYLRERAINSTAKS